MVTCYPVQKFIARFNHNEKYEEVIDTFKNGCCYWFARILYERFSFEADEIYIVYDEVINHWGCYIDGLVYDISGEVTTDYNWELWSAVMARDELLAARLVRDCIYF